MMVIFLSTETVLFNHFKWKPANQKKVLNMCNFFYALSQDLNLTNMATLLIDVI